MADYDRLRYRLMPYIYTLAADTYVRRRHDHARAGDGFRRPTAAPGASTTNICSGRALLAAPVTAFKARQPRVYLPAGASWYDFHTGRA